MRYEESLPLGFQRIPLDLLFKEERLLFDLFIKVQGHFLLYRREKQIFDDRLHRQLHVQGVTYCYIPLEDLPGFYEYLSKGLSKLHSNQKILFFKRAEKLFQIFRFLSREIYESPQNPYNLQALQLCGISLASLIDSQSLKTSFSIQKVLSSKASFGSTLKPNQDYSLKHAFDVGVLSVSFAKFLDEFDREALKEIAISGFFHDVGTFLMPEVLEKEERLSVEDWEKVHKHPEYTVRILKKAGIDIASVNHAILFHHQSNDGTGYPEYQPKILSKEAQILAFCDHYSSMTARKLYQGPLSPYAALQKLGLKFYETSPDLYKHFVRFIQNFA